jgi:hypothetical protein
MAAELFVGKTDDGENHIERPQGQGGNSAAYQWGLAAKLEIAPWSTPMWQLKISFAIAWQIRTGARQLNALVCHFDYSHLHRVYSNWTGLIGMTKCFFYGVNSNHEAFTHRVNSHNELCNYAFGHGVGMTRYLVWPWVTLMISINGLNGNPFVP